MRKAILSTILALVFTGANANQCCFNDCCPMPDNFNVSAQFLWWKAECENYAVVFNNVDTAVTPFAESHTYLPFSFGWDPGFRLGVDYQTCICGRNIDFFAEWTRFRSTDSHHESQLSGNAIQASFTLTTPSGISFFTASPQTVTYDGQADFLYNRLDIGCISESYCLANFIVNPSAAFTYVHTRFAFTDNIETSIATTSIRSTNTYFDGVGVTLGADMACSLLDCFSLYSKSLLTAMWGKYNYSASGLLSPGQSTVISALSLDQHHSTWRGRWIADFEIGLEYNMYICGKFPFFARLGWEFQYMPNMNLMRELGGNSDLLSPNDVTINGLVLGFKVGF